MRHLRTIINENTPISIGLLVIIIGGISWLTAFYAKAQSTAEAVGRIENNQTEYTRNLMEINERLSRIEGRLNP